MEAPGNNITTRARGSSIWLNCTPSPLRTSATRGKISKSPIVSVREIRSPSSLTPKPKRKKPSRAVKRASSKTYAPARLQRAVHLRLAGPGREQMASTIAQCPVLTPEFRSIQDRHQALASTGCTAQFCQAGRMLHTDEPRVGENRALKVVEEDAKIFLQELHQEHFFGSDEAFCERLRTVLKEIRTGAVNAKIRQTQKQGKVGGNWTQTPAELEFGLRRAWRNSRKCIMRSHCEELK
ncbi:MAG: hypothetical protein HETSPECPRED_008435 [Heterodermia speciosa]|uniref:Nitric oxide synthase (NOS) domain-containing protein n=1 Tax=Heterodermia speciosa TaxID=116794 RepID=A0A8H3FXN6_9LECA|nr:MAG: hypothetical protein HETSPECPRED_008435 [Heterodermia speciosa]